MKKLNVDLAGANSQRDERSLTLGSVASLDAMLACAKERGGIQRKLISEAAARLYHDAVTA